MSTISLDLGVTLSERRTRRSLVPFPLYAGHGTSSYDINGLRLAGGDRHDLSIGEAGGAVLVVSVDMDTAIVVGWVAGGATHELPVNQLAVMTLPLGVAEAYVRNDGAAVSEPTPVKIFVINTP